MATQTQEATEKMADEATHRDNLKATEKAKMGRPIEMSELMVTVANGPVIRKSLKTKDVQDEIKKIFTLGVSKDHGAGHRTFGPDKIEYIDDCPVTE